MSKAFRAKCLYSPSMGTEEVGDFWLHTNSKYKFSIHFFHEWGMSERRMVDNISWFNERSTGICM